MNKNRIRSAHLKIRIKTYGKNKANIQLCLSHNMYKLFFTQKLSIILYALCCVVSWGAIQKTKKKQRL